MQRAGGPFYLTAIPACRISWVQARECEARVLYQMNGEAKISRHANGGLYRVVRNHACHYQRGVSSGSQNVLEVCSDERVGLVLSDHALGVSGARHFLELIAALTRGPRSSPPLPLYGL